MRLLPDRPSPTSVLGGVETVGMSMKSIEVVPIAPPAEEQRVQREARFAPEGARKSRYTLPDRLKSASPVGYRHRVSLSQEQAHEALQLLAMERPQGFAEPGPVSEQVLFEESSLGVLSSRQSTNFRGHQQFTLPLDEPQQRRRHR